MKESNCNKNCNKVLQINNLVNQVCALLMYNVACYVNMSLNF